MKIAQNCAKVGSTLVKTLSIALAIIYQPTVCITKSNSKKWMINEKIIAIYVAKPSK